MTWIKSDPCSRIVSDGSEVVGAAMHVFSYGSFVGCMLDKRPYFCLLFLYKTVRSRRRSGRREMSSGSALTVSLLIARYGAVIYQTVTSASVLMHHDNLERQASQLC